MPISKSKLNDELVESAWDDEDAFLGAVQDVINTEQVIRDKYGREGKIVLRDKKFIELLNILKTFKHYEDSRMKFIQKVKNLNVHDILDKIDNATVVIVLNNYTRLSI